MTRPLPPSASVAHPLEGGKLHAPAAARNAQTIGSFLTRHAPATGDALEIASGTGQHVVHFAPLLPGLQWQPTDIDPPRLRSIDAHVSQAGLSNVAPALHLDATQDGWARHHGPYDLILLANLLHLVSAPQVVTLITEAAKALKPGGVLMLYGPYARDGQLTSPGDQRFDAQLRAADPAIGYKDTAEMARWLHAAGLEADSPYQMPANNLIILARPTG